MCGPSNAEQELFDFVATFVDDAEQSNRIILKGKELDIYIPSKSLAIEYNGLYYHSDKFKGKNYHLNKTKNCNKQGIGLIHIFEDEWLNKKNVVKAKIKKYLGLSKRADSEKFSIKNVDKIEKTNFVKKNSLYKNTESDIDIGLYDNNKLIYLLSLKKEQNNYSIVTDCEDKDFTVEKAFIKLLDHTSKKYGIGSFIYTHNLNWPVEGKIKHSGFYKKYITEPEFTYVTKSNPKNRYVSKKAIKNKTVHKIYDCGTIKFEKEYNIKNKLTP